MEHPIAFEQVWRTRAIVAAGVAAVELVVLLLVGVSIAGRALSAEVQESARNHVLTKDQAVPKRPKRSAPSAPKLARSETSVLVLNGNGRTGAAAETAARVRGLSYTVGGVGNAPRSDYGATVVMYRPGYGPEATRLARDLKIKIVGPLDGLRVRDLMGAHVALVVGS